ncbi:MAG TPA: hypothetical protein DIU35_12225 [Candidatus Latescibacteria bacterium]|nr:hypothetical protein [Gemmatimonadota bacterium]HCR18240.1 hypothetical protein [Candidatus Latescibacterota bacterium]
MDSVVLYSVQVAIWENGRAMGGFFETNQCWQTSPLVNPKKNHSEDPASNLKAHTLGMIPQRQYNKS